MMKCKDPWIHYGWITLLAAGLILLTTGCGRQKSGGIHAHDGFGLMADYIEKHTDFVNSEPAPGSVAVDAILNYNGTRLHLVDLRPGSEYRAGHLPAAVNVEMPELLEYIENRIDPGSFDTIALISSDGQDAYFATTLLRILGYDNVYALRLGMGWHRQFADSAWGKHISSAYQDRLSTEASPPKQEHPYPVVKTSFTDGYLLLRGRAAGLLASGYKQYKISVAEVFEKTGDYYIVNYWPPHEYEVGHIPGAVQYNPKKSLNRKAELNTLPTDRTVVIYCHQGFMSASATAYLMLLGYDARSLAFGTTSFMYDIHVGQVKRNYFDKNAVFDYPLADDSETKSDPGTHRLMEVKAQGGC